MAEHTFTNGRGNADAWYDNENDVNWGEVSEAGEFLLLKPGAYAFTVDDHYSDIDKSQKGKAIHRHTVTLKVETVHGTATIRDFFRVTKSGVRSIKAFFTSLGLTIEVQPDWDAIIGRSGKATLEPNDYEKDGKVFYCDRVGAYITDNRELMNQKDDCLRQKPTESGNARTVNSAAGETSEESEEIPF